MLRIITEDVERRDDVKRRKITQKINRIIYDKVQYVYKMI